MTTEVEGFARVLEFQRTWPDVDVERFLWLHAGCSVESKTDAENSSDIDSTTGDLKPIFKEFFVCGEHSVRSASRDVLEV